ncbi:MAG: ABC transporter ATP-binding protein/permease [Bdellovibrionales bacterium]
MEEKVNSGWGTLKILGKHLWPEGRWDLRLRVVIALFFLGLAKAVNVYVPFLLKQSVDSLTVTEAALILPVGLIVSYGIARLMVSLFGELRDFVFIRVGQHTQRKIALETFQHLHELSLDFHLSRQTGGISRIIERGTRGIQFVLNFMTFNIIPTLIEIAMVTVVLSTQFGYKYALIVLSTIGLYIFLTLFVTEWRLKFRRKMNQSETSANTKAIDSLINFETVKYFGNEKHEYARFDKHLAKYEQAAILSQSSLSLLNIVQATIISSGLVAIMLMAGQSVVDGSMTVGDFVLVNSFLIQLYLPLNFLGFVYREIKNSLTDMDKMFQIININTSVKDKANASEMKCSSGEVEFKNINFSYNKDRSILNNVSFKIHPGTTTAVIGASGSGKSTLARLLFRFYDTSEGTISIDGVNIKDVTQESLRKHIGVVPQDNVLFNESIGYNIAYGKPGASQQEIENAAKLAEIHSFVESLPESYDTPVGERGLKLSGGEKQRVAIARTILKNPKILIFDEATSALDTEKEKEIQESLNKISSDRSTLIIAHRLSTIIHADEIIVLEKGSIVEQGKHHDLLEKKGRYYDLWHQQQEEEPSKLT